MNTRIGAIPFVTLTQHEYGALLLTRGNPADREKALGMLDQAYATAEILGMVGVIKGVQALRSKE
jgi:hypothetical protein